MPIQIRDEDRRDDVPICSPYETPEPWDWYADIAEKMDAEDEAEKTGGSITRDLDTVPAGFEPTDHTGVLIAEREVSHANR